MISNNAIYLPWTKKSAYILVGVSIAVVEYNSNTKKKGFI